MSSTIIDMQSDKNRAFVHMTQCIAALKIQRDTGLKHSKGSVRNECKKRYGLEATTIADAVKEMEYLRYCLEHGIRVADKPRKDGLCLFVPDTNEALYEALTKLHPNDQYPDDAEPRVSEHEAIVNGEPATVYHWWFLNPPNDEAVTEGDRSPEAERGYYVIWNRHIIGRAGEGHRV
jgi:hypothetical protein